MGIGSIIADQLKDVVVQTAVREGTKLATGAIEQGANKVSEKMQGGASQDGEQAQTAQQENIADEKGMTAKAVQGTANFIGDTVQVVGTIAATIPGVGDVVEVAAEVIGGGIKMTGAAVTLDGDKLQEETAVAASRVGVGMLPISVGTAIAKPLAEEAVRAGFNMKNAGVSEPASNDANMEQDISPKTTPAQEQSTGQDVGRA